jgi:protein-disulfide isomerase
MRHWVSFLWIFIIVLIFSVAYIITTNPYLQSKRDNSFIGENNASILIIEFGDYLDPVTIQIEESMRKLRENYSVKFIYKHYPESNASTMASMAAKCVGNQGYFEEMHELIFENHLIFNSTNIYEWADTISGVKIDQMKQCMSVKLYEMEIERDKGIGDNLNIENLPVVFINGARFDGMNSYGVYSNFIEQELNS